MKVVIVGGGAGGISTASNIRKLDKDIEITVLTRDNKVAYSPCAIPYVLSGTIESFDDIVMRTPEDYKEKNIEVITEVEVTFWQPAEILLCLQCRGLNWTEYSESEISMMVLGFKKLWKPPKAL